VELPPMSPAEAKKFLIEASFSCDSGFCCVCVSTFVHFRLCIVARLLVMVCAV
jgi:hypothetical protein